jgi:hypothetical protein
MTGITILNRTNSDITMDEQSSMSFWVDTTYPDGTALDLTGATVTWVAAINGVQQIKKDTPTMLVMLNPVPTTTLSSGALAGQNNIVLTKVAGFGADSWGRPIPSFAAGDTVNITDSAGGEVNIIASINGNILTMVNSLSNAYTTANGAAATMAITSFTFSLLPGDTILPVTKSYGTPIIYEHMAQVNYPVGLSPSDIYQQPTTIVPLRGRIFINPILDMS